jgi:hypothetical protein
MLGSFKRHRPVAHPLCLLHRDKPVREQVEHVEEQNNDTRLRGRVHASRHNQKHFAHPDAIAVAGPLASQICRDLFFSLQNPREKSTRSDTMFVVFASAAISAIGH